MSLALLHSVSACTQYICTAAMIWAQEQKGGPLGPEFGKASPIGLFVLVVLAVAVLTLGWLFARRFQRMNRRQVFAKNNGIDPFDQEEIDKQMAAQGILDRNKRTFL